MIIKRAIIKLIFVFLFFNLIVLTAFSFFHHSFLSAELTARTTETSSQNRTDYIDENGLITFAEDKGYASVVKTLDSDGHVILEQYLDAEGYLIAVPAGYAQIQRFYENGHNTIIAYLDVNGSPAVINNGYDRILRSFNSSGRVDTDTYWIGNSQVQRKQGYWAYQRIYEKKKISELRYLDQSGNLVNNSGGYALIRRSYQDKATIDLYFDAELHPVSSSLGQYGMKTETVDNVKITTYLGEDGEISNTDRGYAIVKKDGSKTLYYDQNGDPVTAGRFQYGIQIISGHNVLLDEDGNPMLRLDNVLHTSPILVLVFGVLLTLLLVIARGKGRIIFLILYIGFILLMTLAFREPGHARARLELFYSYRSFLSSAETRQNIINNIWLFVPLGAALYSKSHPWRLIWAFILSAAIELIQYFTGIGLCEMDDIINNSLGALIGFGMAYTFDQVIQKLTHNSQ